MEALFFVVQRCFLQELGFTDEQSVTLFQRNMRYTSALRFAEFLWII